MPFARSGFDVAWLREGTATNAEVRLQRARSTAHPGVAERALSTLTDNAKELTCVRAAESAARTQGYITTSIRYGPLVDMAKLSCLVSSSRSCA